MEDFPGTRFSTVKWMTFQLRVNRQVGSRRITSLRSKLHRIETGSSKQSINLTMENQWQDHMTLLDSMYIHIIPKFWVSSTARN